MAAVGRLPFMAMGIAVAVAVEAWQRTRGPRDFALRRGAEVLQLVGHTPLGRLLPQPSLPDGVEVEAEQLAAQAREAAVATVTEAAPPTARVVAETTTAQLDIDEPQSHDDLPITDFDNVTLGSLRSRLRSLSLEELATLRSWEKAHGDRLPVLTLLDNRIAKVKASDDNAGTAYPSDPQTRA